MGVVCSTSHIFLITLIGKDIFDSQELTKKVDSRKRVPS